MWRIKGRRQAGASWAPSCGCAWQVLCCGGSQGGALGWGLCLRPQQCFAHAQNKAPFLAQLLSQTAQEHPWVHGPAHTGLAGPAACIPVTSSTRGLSPPRSSPTVTHINVLPLGSLALGNCVCFLSHCSSAILPPPCCCRPMHSPSTCCFCYPWQGGEAGLEAGLTLRPGPQPPQEAPTQGGVRWGKVSPFMCWRGCLPWGPLYAKAPCPPWLLHLPGVMGVLPDYASSLSALSYSLASVPLCLFPLCCPGLSAALRC